MVQEQINDAKSRMHKAVEALKSELASVRGGRASTGLVDHLKVDYYGTPTPLNQIATIAAPDAKLIVITPYDRGGMSAIEKAILMSDLGLSPSNDGTVIRLSIPPLTEDRRRELAKHVRKRVEDARVAVRNIRRDIHDHVRKMEHEHQISQDDLHRSETDLQKATDDQIKEIDRIGEEKEKEILAV
ncbi:MAG TPA: ribosome recycling factor, partial [Dehalococcoidia bacterium]|nr:ribosome recycling factor [Dehalococcoidia bacterium]